MAQAPSQAARPDPRPGRRRAAVGRVLGAQESGLVLVILLLGTLLALAGGTNIKRVPLALGPTDRYDVAAAGDGFAVTITRGPDTVVYNSARRPTTGSPAPDGSRLLYLSREANAFLDRENLVLIAKDASFIAVMAVGMTAVIILGGIDLSVGSIYAVAAIVGALALRSMHAGLWPTPEQPLSGWMPGASAWLAVPVGLVVCMGVGAVCGLANGAMVVGLRVHPFVITLGMLAALRGVAVLIPKQVLGEGSVGGFPPAYQGGFFRTDILGVQPVPILFMLAVAALGWFVLSRTVFGRRVYAIGGNETAARYAGVPVGRVKIAVYTIMGLLAGLSAAMYIGYFGAAATDAGEGYELQVIAATVIGGASLSGGRGTAIGAVLGAILVRLIDSGMLILRIPQEYNQIVMGLAIIVAVVVDQAKAALSKSRRG